MIYLVLDYVGKFEDWLCNQILVIFQMGVHFLGQTPSTNSRFHLQFKYLNIPTDLKQDFQNFEIFLKKLQERKNMLKGANSNKIHLLYL